MIGIYGFQNKTTKKWYIGQSIHIQKRKNEHYLEAIQYRKKTKFYSAIRKYGWEDFNFFLLEECEPSQLNEKEIFWIKFYNAYENGYNATPGGDSKYFDPQFIFDAWDKGLSVKEINQELGIGLTCIRNNLTEYKNYSYQESHKRGGKLAYKNKQDKENIKYTIYQLDLDNNLIAKWPSAKEIQRKLNIDASSIGKCINGKRKTAGGFKWQKIFE